MSSGESSDGDQAEVQQNILDHLNSYLDAHLGDSPSRKKKKKQKKKKTNEPSPTSEQTTQISSGHHVDVDKIKRLASENKRAKLYSKVKDRDSIKEKMKQVLNKPRKKETKSEESHMSTDEEIEDEDEPHDDMDIDNESDDGFGDDFGEGFGDGSDDGFGDDEEIGDSGSKTNKQLDKFKKALGITEADLRQSRESNAMKLKENEEKVVKRVETVASRKGTKRPPPSVVVFQDRKSAPKKKKPSAETNSDEEDEEDVAFDMKRARHEVRRFGVSGLQGSEKEAGMVDLLVKLGAKAPKRTYSNYKDLQTQRKQEAVDAAQQRDMNRKLGFKVINPNKKKRRSVRDKNDVGVVDGQMGSYKRGVQVVASRDIASVTQKKTRR